MNLILDIGNTRAKVALFSGGELNFFEAYSQISLQLLESLISKHDIKKVIVSTTGNFTDETERWLRLHISCFVQLHADLFFPFQIRYGTRHTLGNDRIAGIAGAQELFPASNCLVVDAGTAITFDLIDSEGVFWGGNISPGLTMRFQALHTFTQKLPLIHQVGEMPLLGHSTETAIRSGVVWGVIFEIERYIAKLASKYPDLKVILTGGDAVFLADKINYPIFVDEFLVLKGLNRILEYNAHT